MKKTVLAITLCLVLAACSGSKDSDKDKAAQHESKPVENLLTAADMSTCEQQLGIAAPKTSADVYSLSADSISRVKDCAYGLEKQRMPLLADLVDKYKQMLQQGNNDCGKDIGTHYAQTCMRDSQSQANEWYNLAVSQRLQDALPNQRLGQPQTTPKP